MNVKFVNDIEKFMTRYLGTEVKANFTILNKRNGLDWVENNCVASSKNIDMTDALDTATSHWCLQIECDRGDTFGLSQGIGYFAGKLGADGHDCDEWKIYDVLVMDHRAAKKRGFGTGDFETLYPYFNDDFCKEVLGIDLGIE